MTPDQARTLMALRGYTVQWTSASRETMGLVKEHDPGVTIFAQVAAGSNSVTLEYQCEPPSMLRVTTGQFALDHPEFEKFERNVVKAAQALCLCGV